MKKGFPISLTSITIILVILTFSFIVEAQVKVIKEWADSSSDASTFLEVYGEVYAHVFWSPPHAFKANGDWCLGSTAYASASAWHMGDHTEYHVYAWVEATGDTDNAPIPGRGNINQKRPGWDNEGRAYEYDFHGDAESGVAYKKHPVSSTVKPWWNRVNPWAEQVIRNFDLSIYCFYMDRHPNNPDNLTADPHVISEISGTSMKSLNMGIGSTSIATP